MLVKHILWDFYIHERDARASWVMLALAGVIKNKMKFFYIYTHNPSYRKFEHFVNL